MARWLRRDLVNDNKCVTSVYIKIPRNRRHYDFNPDFSTQEHTFRISSCNFFSVFGTSAGILWGAARILSIILNTRSAATYNEKWNFELGYFPHFSYIFITFCVPTNLFYCTSETFIIYCGIKPTKSQNRKGAINCDVDTGAKLRIPATLQIPWGK